MLERSFAALFGFSILLPGIALVSVGDIGLQPMALVVPLYVLAALLGGQRVPLNLLLWILLALLAMSLASLLSVDPGFSLKYLYIATPYLLAIGVAGGLVALSRRDRLAFLSGYLTGALVSSLVAVAQVASWKLLGFSLMLANNPNFSLVEPWGRATGFTPESSILASVLQPAVLLLYIERREGRSALPRILVGLPALLLLATGLLLTKSTSLLLLPAMILLYEVLSLRAGGSFILRLLRHAVIGILLAAVFLPFYAERLRSSDAHYSTSGRLEKLAGGLRVAAEQPVLGAGLGMVSNKAFFGQYVERMADWDWAGGGPEARGVDSVAVRTLAETGLLGLILFYYPVVLFAGAARRAAAQPSFRPLVPMALALLVSQLVVSGYRDLGMFLLPMAFFAVAPSVAGEVLRQRVSRPAVQSMAP